jgi:hypothetical protein
VNDDPRPTPAEVAAERDPIKIARMLRATVCLPTVPLHMRETENFLSRTDVGARLRPQLQEQT